jgi:AraC-like DNA-binding protein
LQEKQALNVLPDKPLESLPGFVSRQVEHAQRFFLNLDPNRKSSLAVVAGGVERMRPDYLVERTDFPYFAVELVAEGTGSLQIGGRAFSLEAGTAFAYGPHTAHVIRNCGDEGMRKYYLDFTGTTARSLLRSAGLIDSENRFSAIRIDRIHEATQIFDQLLREGDQNQLLAESLCEALTRVLFLKLQQLNQPSDRQMPKAAATFDRVRQFIDLHFLSLDSAQEIADRCDITPVHLSRLFRRFHDCGAYQYLLRRKMNYAAGLLMNEGLLVREVAMRLNFADPFRFSRSFKRVYGVAPGHLTRFVETRATTHSTDDS